MIPPDLGSRGGLEGLEGLEGIIGREEGGPVAWIMWQHLHLRRGWQGDASIPGEIWNARCLTSMEESDRLVVYCTVRGREDGLSSTQSVSVTDRDVPNGYCPVLSCTSGTPMDVNIPPFPQGLGRLGPLGPLGHVCESHTTTVSRRGMLRIRGRVHWLYRQVSTHTRRGRGIQASRKA